MPNTPVYTDGVKYIKIAKQDSGSIDNSIELQNLTDIRIKFSDINNAVQYNIASVTEYSTYYLYNIVPLNVTSSADQEILDYKISGSGGSIISNGLLAAYSIQSGTNTLGYFNGTYLNMGNTPNISLNVIFDLSQSSTLPTTMSIYQYNTSSNGYIGDPILSLYFPDNKFGTTYITRTGSFTPIEGYSYGFTIDNILNYYDSAFIITQSFAPESSNYDIIVLEPYVGDNFYNSDCNVIQNNVDFNTINPLYMDVDFNGGQIVAQNQTAILNGTAPRAQVQPWNYSYYSQISGRYVGKQQNAIALNTYTGPTSYTNGTSSAYGYTGSWPGDSASPGAIVPGNIVIQWLDSCIYEMNWGGPGFPENVNGGGLSMGNIYLVGETRDDVAIIKPGTDIYYDILEKTFPSGSPAFQYQYVNSPTLSTQLNITYPSLLLPSATYYVASNFEEYPGAGGWGLFYPTGSPLFPFPFVDVTSIPSISFTPSANINFNGDLYQDTSALVRNDYLLGNLNDGNRWFMSFYSGSGTTGSLVGGLPPSCSTTLQQVGFPFEIDQYINTGSNNIITFKDAAAIKYWFETGSAYSSSVSPYRQVKIGAFSNQSNAGILITKAQYPTNGLTIFGLPNSNFAGAGQGYILSQYPKKIITENIDYILRTYGNQPTT
jgi:hypothetical protein